MGGLEHDYGLTFDSTFLEKSRGAWLELARVAGCDDDNLPEPETLAQLINLNPDAKHIPPQLFRAIHEGTAETGAGADAAYARVSRLLVGLDAAVLAKALRHQEDAGLRKSLLHAAVTRLHASTLQVLARAAGIVYEHTASPALQGLLSKLELQASGTQNGNRAEAESSYRQFLHVVIDAWAAASAPADNALQYPRSAKPDIGAPADAVPEPQRIVQLALESGALGGVVWAAVNALSGETELRGLLSLLKDAPEQSVAAREIGRRFATTERLAKLLREDPVDFSAVDTLLRHLQLSAADTLLDELVNSNSRVTRRGIIERLARLGPSIETQVAARLTDERWYVQRNMLHVLNEAGCSVANIPLIHYQNHADPRVRREAMQLLFKDEVTRERALAMAFRDSDPSMLRTALKAARSGVFDSAVPILAKRVLDPDFPPEFRLPSIQLLGRSKSLLALDALLRFAQSGTTLLGKPRLAPRSLEMLAALRGLLRNWSHERRAMTLLEMAAESPDPEVKAAIEPITDDTAREAVDGIE